MKLLDQISTHDASKPFYTFEFFPPRTDQVPRSWMVVGWLILYFLGVWEFGFPNFPAVCLESSGDKCHLGCWWIHKRSKSWTCWIISKQWVNYHFAFNVHEHEDGSYWWSFESTFSESQEFPLAENDLLSQLKARELIIYLPYVEVCSFTDHLQFPITNSIFKRPSTRWKRMDSVWSPLYSSHRPCQLHPLNTRVFWLVLRRCCRWRLLAKNPSLELIMQTKATPMGMLTTQWTKTPK